MIRQVESLGRNPRLESLGFFGRHSYWIRCGSCLSGGAVEGADSGNNSEGHGHRESSSRGEQGEGEDGSGGERGAAEAEDEAAGPQGSEEESEDSDESDSSDDEPAKPEPMPFAVALTLLQDHPAAKTAFLLPRCGVMRCNAVQRDKRYGAV